MSGANALPQLLQIRPLVHGGIAVDHQTHQLHPGRDISLFCQPDLLLSERFPAPLHTEGKGQLEGIEVPSRPVGRRRRLVHALKRLGEGLLALVSALQSDLADGPSGKSQQLGRLSEPAALHIVMKRHSHRLCEHAVQVVFGVVDRLRHRLQFQPAAQAALDIPDDGLYPTDRSVFH